MKIAGGRLVVEVNKARILVADVDGDIFAVSNKCSHLGLPLVGKVRFILRFQINETERRGQTPFAFTGVFATA